MATITVNISSFNLSVSGNTQVNGNITWSAPTVPADATIVSCTLTGRATASMSKGSTTTKVNNSTVSSGSSFTIDLGTDISVTSVAVNTKGGNKNASGTVTFDNLVYTVEYEEPGTEEPEPDVPADGNIFPPFTNGTWILDSTVATNTLLENYSYGFTTEDTSGWKGYYAPIPDSWYGHAIRIGMETITENATLCIQTADTFEEIFALNSNKTEGIARIIPGKQYVVFLRTNYLSSGEVIATNVYAKDEGELPKLDSFTLNKHEMTAYLNSSSVIGCLVSPEDAMYNFVWTSTDAENMMLSGSGAVCNILPLALGTYTLTATDSLTGLTDSCIVEVVEGNGSKVNIFPPFNQADGWYLDNTCTLLDISAYSCSFNAVSTWSGISISLPEEWYGRSIQLKCEDISTNACLYIQETDAWSEIGVLSPDNKLIEFDVPEQGTYTNIVLVLQAHTEPGLISISGVEAIYTDVVSDVGQTYVQFENRIVGYKQSPAETAIDGAIICQTSNEIVSAINNAKAGDTIYIRRGFYTFEGGLNIKAQGSASNYITIKNYPGEPVIFMSSPINFTSGAKYINFEGIAITDLYDLHWASALRVMGGTSYINFKDIEVYNITCREIVGEDTSGCNPFLIYADPNTSITNITVDNCYIHDCDTGWSEALTLNGNVSNCTIKNCAVKDITNIGIDLAGNYEWTGTVGDPNNQTHDCIVENCLIMNCQSPYATSAGLYSDGSRDNTFRYNVIYNCQCGIELGSEQPGSVSENFHVHNNLIIDSGRCIGVGAYLETGAQNRNAYIYNNTFVCGDSNHENYGLYVERSDNVNFYNNIVYGTSQTTLLSNGYNSNIKVGNNCWYKESGLKPSIDINGIFADPQFTNNNLTINGNYQLVPQSPCINAGTKADAALSGETDLNGNVRIRDMIDIGCFEYMGDIVALLMVKENNEWLNVFRVYKKVNGVWVVQDGSSVDALFNSDAKYVYK